MKPLGDEPRLHALGANDGSNESKRLRERARGRFADLDRVRLQLHILFVNHSTGYINLTEPNRNRLVTCSNWRRFGNQAVLGTLGHATVQNAV